MKNSISKYNIRDQEYTLDVLLFLKDSWVVIVLMGVLGGVISSAFFIVTPNQYEAVATIAMGRQSKFADDVESPTALIARFSLPGGFDEATVSACDRDSGLSKGVAPHNHLKMSELKGFNSAVQIKAIHQSPEQAMVCVNTLFNSIVKSHLDVIDRLERNSRMEKNSLLIKTQERLAQNRIILDKLGSPRGSLNPI